MHSPELAVVCKTCCDYIFAIIKQIDKLGRWIWIHLDICSVVAYFKR
jgi:hypothetical protein